jgi:hypothetical protein
MTKEDVSEKIIRAISSINEKLDDEHLEKIENELTAIEDAATEDLYKVI